MHLPAFGWEPVMLTVDEKYYEEKLDWNLEKLLPEGLRIEKVDAFRITKPRLIGDIGIRGFFQMAKKAIQLIKKEKFDFLYIPIPSFYGALIGRWVHALTGIPYGIDYIDPWVHIFPGSNKIFSRHWLSTRLAMFLEPIAVKKAKLISGVSEGYYKGVLDRNPHLKQQAIGVAMPYGGEKSDHDKVSVFKLSPYLFAKKEGIIQLVYAGAMLPKAYQPLEMIFKTIAVNFAAFENIEFHFIGTGKLANDPNSYNIKPLAEKYGLWQKIVYEYPSRIPYLDVLIHLEAADGVFILGSTEAHYTPSKVYQAVLSQKPVWAMLHKASSACKVLSSSGAGIVLDFNGENGLQEIEDQVLDSFHQYLLFLQNFNPANIVQQQFEAYSAKAATAKLVQALNSCIK